MKIYIALLLACFAAMAYAQGQSGAQAAAAQAAVAQAQAAAAAGGAAGAAAASAGRDGLFGNPLMGLAAMSGQLGDGLQTVSMCQMIGIPIIFCLGGGVSF